MVKQDPDQNPDQTVVRFGWSSRECRRSPVTKNLTITRNASSSVTKPDHRALIRLPAMPPGQHSVAAATRCERNPRTVMNMANDGRLPASRIAGSRKFHYFLDDIISALRESRVEPSNIADDPPEG